LIDYLENENFIDIKKSGKKNRNSQNYWYRQSSFLLRGTTAGLKMFELEYLKK